MVMQVMIPISRRMVASLAFAGIWIAAAAIRPTTTFHLAPLIVVVWPALTERDLRRALPMTLAAVAMAAATTGLLFIAGWLRGPSLLPWGGATLESVVAIAVGAVIGLTPSLGARLDSRPQ